MQLLTRLLPLAATVTTPTVTRAAPVSPSLDASLPSSHDAMTDTSTAANRRGTLHFNAAARCRPSPPDAPTSLQ
jgi:hypothetical protein